MQRIETSTKKTNFCMDLLHTSWYYNSPEIFRAFANDYAKIKSRPRDEGELVVVG